MAKREPGDVVEVRVYFAPNCPSWHVRCVAQRWAGGGITVEPTSTYDSVAHKLDGTLRLFGPPNVRGPRRRETTGKVRGRGGAGGWVPQ